MAKKSKKKEEETKKVVAKCDNPNEVVANSFLESDQRSSGNNPDEVIANSFLESDQRSSGENPQETSLSQYDIEKLIVTVRGEQVLIDQDIARIYGVTTSRLNQQAKRNIARFPESFRFQLTKEERDEVVAKCDNLRSLKFYPSLPYAYTEQGIGQLFKMLLSIPKINAQMKRLTDNGYPVKSFLDIVQNDNETNTIVYTSKMFQPCSETFSDSYHFIGP